MWSFDQSLPAFADETPDFNDVDDADLAPFPSPSAEKDYFAIGYTSKFDNLIFDDANGTQGENGDVEWQYWSGSEWSALSIETDDTSGFTSTLADGKVVAWTTPPDWVPTRLNDTEPLYYVRAVVTDAYSTEPVLDQGLIGGKLVVRAYGKSGYASRRRFLRATS